MHLNVRSLLTSIDQFSLEFNKFDIIALSETLLDEYINNSDSDITGYSEPFQMDRNRHGGGVCIYVKPTLLAERCYELEDNRMECIWLKYALFTKLFISHVFIVPLTLIMDSGRLYLKVWKRLKKMIIQIYSFLAI